MRAVFVPLKVSSTKNLVKFCHFLQAGNTLFSVVSYYLKGSGECSKNLCHAGGGGNSLTQKSQNMSYTFILLLRNPPKVRNIVLFWKNFLLFQRNEWPLDRKPQNIHHFLTRQPIQFFVNTHKSFLQEGPHTGGSWLNFG